MVKVRLDISLHLDTFNVLDGYVLKKCVLSMTFGTVLLYTFI